MSSQIDSLLNEARVFSPSADFSQQSHVDSLPAYHALYQSAKEDPEKFWGDLARQLKWHTPFTKVLSWEPPFARWFEDGTLNISENCLDRHLEGPRRNKPALIWQGEPGESRSLTYF